MKQSLFKWGLAPLVVCALLAPTPMLAEAIRFKSTAWFLGYLLDDIVCVSDRGVSLKGNVHEAKFVSDEARVTGLGRAVNLDTALNSDGSATFSGRLWLEVGTWDAAGKFTRTDGVWEIDYSGLLHVDGSVEFTKMTGRGIGGTIDGLHIAATATRASSSPDDPYLGTGKITGPNN